MWNPKSAGWLGMAGAYFVDEQPGDGLLLYVYEIAAKYHLPQALLLAVYTGAGGLCVCPLGVFPAREHDEFVLALVKAESDVTVV